MSDHIPFHLVPKLVNANVSMMVLGFAFHRETTYVLLARLSAKTADFLTQNKDLSIRVETVSAFRTTEPLTVGNDDILGGAQLVPSEEQVAALSYQELAALRLTQVLHTSGVMYNVTFAIGGWRAPPAGLYFKEPEEEVSVPSHKKVRTITFKTRKHYGGDNFVLYAIDFFTAEKEKIVSVMPSDNSD